ncbi:hypothetical protein B0A50_08392 [Salinomyces thailandicus]|uniref:Uncharacterized protein n=1 Tax=Salinomyces thailandicus TaxID=706561 RepID=A0A4U0TLC1_9PEZI|nr:hypothetical protein B0A50_08392 [Salinomyces thailandica]
MQDTKPATQFLETFPSPHASNVRCPPPATASPLGKGMQSSPPQRNLSQGTVCLSPRRDVGNDEIQPDQILADRRLEAIVPEFSPLGRERLHSLYEDKRKSLAYGSDDNSMESAQASLNICTTAGSSRLPDEGRCEGTCLQ